MKINPFLLERYFDRYEFKARYLLSCSDCESLSLSNLLDMADDETGQLWRELTLGYTESSGHPLLRESISESYREMDKNDIVVTAPEEGIFLFMHALLSPGDHVISTFPGYQSLYEVARSIGCKVSNWEPEEENGWHFNLARLDENITENTRLVVVNFPHNPTGYLPSRDEFQALTDFLKDRDIWMLSDEMYRFLETGEGTTLPAACDLYHRAFSLSGLSKSFGLPGLRIGWLASKNREVLDRVRGLKDYTTICSSAPSEVLAVIAMRNRPEIIRQHRERLKKNLKHIERFFREHRSIFSCNLPGGGTVCFPRMHISDATSVFCKKLVEERGIMLVPSGMFQFGEAHVRMGLGRENMPRILELLSAYLRDNYPEA